MQSVELVILAVVVIALLALVGRRYRLHGRAGPGVGIALGAIVGLLGAIAALAIVTDVVPDSFEDAVRPAAVGLITLVAVVGSVVRFAR